MHMKGKSSHHICVLDPGEVISISEYASIFVVLISSENRAFTFTARKYLMYVYVEQINLKSYTLLTHYANSDG